MNLSSLIIHCKGTDIMKTLSLREIILRLIYLHKLFNQTKDLYISKILNSNIF